MPPDHVLSDVLHDFTSAAAGYYPDLATWGLAILSTITFLQVGYIAVQCGWLRDPMRIVDALIIGFMRIGIVYTVIAHALEWGVDLVSTGTQVGASVSGISTTSLGPSDVYNVGLTMVNALFGARTLGMWLHPINDVGFLVVTSLVQIVWAIAAIFYLWVLIEATWSVVIGPIILGFSTLEYTWPMLFRWIGKLLEVALKVMALLLVLAIGITMAGTWSDELSGLGAAINNHRIYYAVVAFIDSIAFAIMVVVLPWGVGHLAHTYLGGSGGGGAPAGGEMMVGMASVAAGASVEVLSGASGEQLGRYVSRRLLS